jgi:hypothetical protein
MIPLEAPDELAGVLVDFVQGEDIPDTLARRSPPAKRHFTGQFYPHRWDRRRGYCRLGPAITRERRTRLLRRDVHLTHNRHCASSMAPPKMDMEALGSHSVFASSAHVSNL